LTPSNNFLLSRPHFSSSPPPFLGWGFVMSACAFGVPYNSLLLSSWAVATLTPLPWESLTLFLPSLHCFFFLLFFESSFQCFISSYSRFLCFGLLYNSEGGQLSLSSGFFFFAVVPGPQSHKSLSRLPSLWDPSKSPFSTLSFPCTPPEPGCFFYQPPYLQIPPSFFSIFWGSWADRWPPLFPPDGRLTRAESLQGGLLGSPSCCYSFPLFLPPVFLGPSFFPFPQPPASTLRAKKRLLAAPPHSLSHLPRVVIRRFCGLTPTSSCGPRSVSSPPRRR